MEFGVPYIYQRALPIKRRRGGSVEEHRSSCDAGPTWPQLTYLLGALEEFCISECSLLGPNHQAYRPCRLPQEQNLRQTILCSWAYPEMWTPGVQLQIALSVAKKQDLPWRGMYVVPLHLCSTHPLLWFHPCSHRHFQNPSLPWPLHLQIFKTSWFLLLCFYFTPPWSATPLSLPANSVFVSSTPDLIILGKLCWPHVYFFSVFSTL